MGSGVLAGQTAELVLCRQRVRGCGGVAAEHGAESDGGGLERAFKRRQLLLQGPGGQVVDPTPPQPPSAAFTP